MFGLLVGVWPFLAVSLVLLDWKWNVDKSLVFISETLHLRNAKLLINLGSIDLVKLGCFVTKVSNVSS